jgi:hypothetical protein
MAADATVEWGDDGRRVRLIDRLFGDPETGPVRRVSVPALVCGVLAVGLFAVAEALPWMSVRPGNLPGDESLVLTGTTRDFSIENVGGGVVSAYHFGIALLLMVIGAALVSRPHLRRVLSASGFGLTAGLLIMVVGMIGEAGRGGDLAIFYANVDATVERGPYVAIAAVVAAAAALALSGWHPHRSIRRSKPDPAEAEDEDVEPGPIDLTVSSG